MRHPKGLPDGLRGAFAEFWAAYPPRSPNPRALAETAFAAAIRDGATPEQLVGAARGYAAEVRAKGIGEAFVVHARTFLAQRRFQDYAATPAEGGSGSAAPEPIGAVAEPDHAWWPAFKGRVSAAEFRTWIMPLKLCGTAPAPFDTAILEAPSRFHRDMVRERFAEPLKAALGVKQVMLRFAGEPVR